MARIRTIKPAFFRHGGLFDLEQETGLPIRVAFAGLWTACDREGRFEWRPRELKLDALPYDNVDFSRVLDALESRGHIVKYVVDGKVYGFIPSWKDHQAINNKETLSVLPEPRESCFASSTSTRERRVNDATASPLDPSEAEGKGREGKGRERKDDVHASRDASTPAPPAPPPGDPPSDAPAPTSKTRSTGMKTFDTWTAECDAAGVDRIPDGHGVWAYREKVGLPKDMLALHWEVFKRRYMGTSKKYTDWGRTFFNSVKGNWFKLWALRDDEYILTTIGKQAQREHKDLL